MEANFDFFTEYMDAQFEQPNRQSVISHYQSVLEDLCETRKYPPVQRRDILLKLVSYNQLDRHSKPMNNLSTRELCQEIEKSDKFIKYRDAANVFDPLTPPLEIPSVFRLWYHSNGAYRVVNIFDLAVWLASGKRTDPYTRIPFSRGDLEHFYVRIYELLDILYDLDNTDLNAPSRSIRVVEELGQYYLRINFVRLITLGSVMAKFGIGMGSGFHPDAKRLHMLQNFGTAWITDKNRVILRLSETDWLNFAGSDSIYTFQINAMGQMINEEDVEDAHDVELANLLEEGEQMQNQLHFFVHGSGQNIVCIPATIDDERKVLERIDDFTL